MKRDDLKRGRVIWCCNRHPCRPSVSFCSDGSVVVYGTYSGEKLGLSRRSARLLAKRINQALDAWRKAK